MFKSFSSVDLRSRVEAELHRIFIILQGSVPNKIWNDKEEWWKFVRKARLKCLNECKIGYDCTDYHCTSIHNPTRNDIYAGFYIVFYWSSNCMLKHLMPIPPTKLAAVQVACFLLNNKRYIRNACYCKTIREPTSNDLGIDKQYALQLCLQHSQKDASYTKEDLDVLYWCSELLMPNNQYLQDYSVGVNRNVLESKFLLPPTQRCFIPPGNLSHDEIRLCTFAPFFSEPQSPEFRTLAKNGFFFTGCDFTVKCVCCKKHGALFSDGNFSHHDSCCFMTQTSCICLHNVQHMLDNALHPNFNSLQSRLQTFPVENDHSLADAGYFLHGHEVKCWYCNGGISNWENCEDPWQEHARNNPNCNFLLNEKGADFVAEVVLRKYRSNKNRKRWRRFLLVLRFIKRLNPMTHIS